MLENEPGQPDGEPTIAISEVRKWVAGRIIVATADVSRVDSAEALPAIDSAHARLDELDQLDHFLDENT